MFERFTDDARAVVVCAQQEAADLRHDYVGTEHLLLGLLRQGGLASDVLESLGVTLEAARREVAHILGPGHGRGAVSDEVPFTPRARKVLKLALRAALDLGHDSLGTEHLLLGIADENEGVAAAALLRFRLDDDQVRRAVMGRLDGPAAGSSSGETSASRPGRRLPPPASEAIEARERGLLAERVGRELEGLAGYIEAAAAAAERDPSRSSAAERAYVGGALTTLAHLGLLTEQEHETWRHLLLDKLPPHGATASISHRG